MDIDTELERVASFVAAGNFHAAMNIAISAMNECRRQSDPPGVDRCLGVIRGIVETMETAFGSR